METCENCSGKLIWQSDYDYSDLGLEGEGVVSVWLCSECDDYTEQHFRTDEEDEE